MNARTAAVIGGYLATVAAALLIAVTDGARIGGNLQFEDTEGTSSSVIDVNGIVSVPAINPLGDDGDDCTADDGYDDIEQGAQVVVSDQAGETLGVGNLGAGTLRSARCVFGFDIDGVPAGRRFYAVHVGNSNRGEVQHTEQEIRDGVDLSIG